jgi:lipopolysaccharide transport system permease protein
MDWVRRLEHERDLIQVLIAKELRVRYRNTLLGYAWSVLHPLLFVMVYYLVFKVGLRFSTENYVVFLVSVIFAWQWFANSVNSSCNIFINNSDLIKRVPLPQHLLVLAMVFNNMIHFMLAIPIVVLFMLCFDFYPTLNWLWEVPLLLFVQFFLIVGVSLILATYNVYFRDLERLTAIFTMALFFLSPIIFELDRVLKNIPAEHHWMVHLNPMVGLIAAWRSLFMQGVAPLELLISPLCYATVLTLVGWVSYQRCHRSFSELV